VKLDIFNRIGFEIEGLADIDDNLILLLCHKYSLDCELGDDGSIRGNGNPVEIKFDVPIQKFGVIEPFFNELTSAGFHENESCGSHIHLSFKRPIYMTLLSIPDSIFKFQSEYRQRFADKKKYINRLYNRYTEEYIDIYTILDNQTNGSRYRPINFTSLYKHSYGTVEVRILPYMETGEEYRNAVSTILDIISNVIERKLNAMRGVLGQNKIHTKQSEIRIDSEYSFTVNSSRVDLPPIYGSLYKVMPLVIGQISRFNRIKVSIIESEYDYERLYSVKIPNLCKVYEMLFGENKDILVCLQRDGTEFVRFKTQFMDRGLQIMSRIFDYRFSSDFDKLKLEILRNGMTMATYSQYTKSLKLLEKLDKIIVEMGL